MSWVAVAVIGGAAINYFGTSQTNKANAAASKGAGQVDVTTTRNPMAGTQQYRDAGMQAAYEALLGNAQNPYQAALPGAGAPVAPPAAGGGGGLTPTFAASSPPAGGGGRTYGGYTAAQLTANPALVAKLGPSAAAKWAATGGAGGGAAGGGQGGEAGPPDRNSSMAPGGGQFQGESQQTQDIRNSLIDLPKQEAGMYGVAQNYATGTLTGQDQNPLRGAATAAGQAISQDPELAAYEAALRGDLGTGGGSSAGKSSGNGGPIWTGNPAGGTGGWGGSGQAQLQSPYASTTGADAALRELIAGKAAPGEQAAEDAIRQQVEQGRAGNIRELRARAVGSGFYGGDVYKQLEEGAVAQGDQQLANQIAASRFGAYQNALQLGTQYDTSMADISARQAATAAGASANAAALAQQGRLSELGMWGNAIQTGQQGRAGTASALGNLSAGYSNDQQAAFSGINALGASRRSDLTAAGDLSLGSDAARNNYISGQNSLKVGMAGANASRTVGMANVALGQNQLDFGKAQFYDPLSRASAFANALNGFSGGYGTETTQGMDRRSQSPAPYQNPYGAALQGAAVGGQIATAYVPTGSKQSVGQRGDAAGWWG